jgi:glucokinase
MATDYFIAVDLGGTNIRSALFDARDSSIVKRDRVLTEADRGVESVLETIHRSIRNVMPDGGQSVCGIGIGAPGPLDPFRGIIFQAPNLPGWKNIPIRRRLEELLHIPVSVGNDANLAGLAEWKFGAGQTTNDLVYFTISTGIGGGVICGGRMLLGIRGLAAELGHVTVVPDGPPCGCGGRGHLEAVAAGPAIARRAIELLQTGRASSLNGQFSSGGPSRITSQLVAQAAAGGDELARQIFHEAGTYIGRVVADCLAVFNPGVVIIGGGVSQAGDFLLEPIRQTASALAMNPSYTEGLQILQAQLGDDVGLFGAFALAREDYSSRET